MSVKPEKQEFDQYKESYEALIENSLSFARQPHDFYMQIKADDLFDSLAATYSKTDKVKILDIGCGHGVIHPYMIENAPFAMELHGVDPASSVIEVAAKSNPQVHYKYNDGYRLPYEEGMFDVAVATCVMHHVRVEQWEAFLQEARRVLKPGGRIFVYEHNPNNPITAKIVRECPIDADAVLLKSDSLLSLLGKSGFSNEKCRFIIFFPFMGHFFRTMEKMLTWLPLGAQYVASAYK